MSKKKLRDRKEAKRKEDNKKSLLNRRTKMREEASVKKELDRIKHETRERIPPIRNPK